MENLSESVAESTSFAPRPQRPKVFYSPLEELLKQRIKDLEARHAIEIEDKNLEMEQVRNFLSAEALKSKNMKKKVKKYQDEVKELTHKNKCLEETVDTYTGMYVKVIRRHNKGLTDDEIFAIMDKDSDDAVRAERDKKIAEIMSRNQQKTDGEESISEESDTESKELEEAMLAVRKMSEKVCQQRKKEQKAEIEKKGKAAQESFSITDNGYVQMMFLAVAVFSIVNMIVVALSKRKES